MKWGNKCHKYPQALVCPRKPRRSQRPDSLALWLGTDGHRTLSKVLPGWEVSNVFFTVHPGRPTKISKGASHSHRARSSAGGNHFLFGKLRDATTKRCEASTQRLPFWAHRVPVSGCALQRSCWPFRSRLDVTAVYVPWARSIQRLRSTTK